MLLQVRDLVAGYSGLEILHGISMNIEKGKIVAIIGPNGSGKSTLLNAIFGFIKPSRGTVLFKGKNITNLHPYKKVRVGISYVLQRRSIFPQMTVKENLEMGAYVLNDKNRANDTLEFVFKMFPSLEIAKDRLAYQLSGGEQRMTELARGLMIEPDLMIVDEPSLGLAPLMAKQIFERIIEMNKAGITILMVEQNVKAALEKCNYCYALDLGRKHIEGTGEEILKNPELVKLYLPT